jgi:hypothetical protein
MKDITEIKPKDRVFETMEEFYQQKFSTYKIIPSLTIQPGPGFGFKEKGNQTAYFVLGPHTEDFRFDNSDQLRRLAIHEFGHSFVNPLMDESFASIISDTESLFGPIANKMNEQGYPQWWYCVNEHFVRAGEVLILELMNDNSLSKSVLKKDTEVKDFIYLPFVVNRLRTYRIEQGNSYVQSVRRTMLDLKEFCGKKLNP